MAATQDKVLIWKLAGWKLADKVTFGVTSATARITLSPYRALSDSTYLRAGLGNLWLLMPTLGLVLGVLAANETGGLPIPPSTPVFLSIMALGILDAFSGLMGFLPMLVWSLATGHVDSLHAVGGLFGLAVMWFGGAQIGHAFRPVGRWDDEPTKAMRRYRIGGDLIILPLLGGFLMGSFAQVQTFLTGLQVPIAKEVTTVKVVALVAFFARAVFEALVIYNFRDRLASLAWPILPHRNSVVSFAVKLFGLFLTYVAIWSFLGNEWQTFVLLALFASFPLVVWAGRRFPESTLLHRITPRNVLKLAVIILVAQLLVHGLLPRFTDPQMALGWVFVALAGVIMILLVLEQFRGRGWPETWMTRILGAATILLFLAVAQGYISLI